MKPIHLLAALVFGVSNITCAAEAPIHDHDHLHGHVALYGGIMGKARDIDFELVAKADRLHLYVRNHGKPVDIAKASVKLSLLTGSTKREITLKPAGDRLEAMGAFTVAGAKAVALVNIPGKPAMTVRFVMP